MADSRVRSEDGGGVEVAKRRNPQMRSRAMRALSLGETSILISRRTLRSGIGRWRNRIWMIVQCAVTAGVAWWLAIVLLGHQQPVFAAIAAVLTLGTSYGKRYSRALEVGVGVFIGVAIGDLFFSLFGAGVPQMIAAVVISMSVATILGARTLMIMQSAVQAIFVMTLATAPNQGFSRWLDALLGLSLAMLVALLAPTGPALKPRFAAANVLREVADCLRDTSAALDADDPDAADRALQRARNSQRLLSTLSDSIDEALAVARYSLFRSRHKDRVGQLADLYDPLDRLVRNLRVLARRSAVALWRGESVPMAYLEIMRQTAQILEFCANELFEGRVPSEAQSRLIRLGRSSSRVQMADDLSAVVILAQLRSMMTDLLQLSGMPYPQAREAIPEVGR